MANMNKFHGYDIEDATAREELTKKQDQLTAGTNITIDENNVISASGGGGGTGNIIYNGTDNIDTLWDKMKAGYTIMYIPDSDNTQYILKRIISGVGETSKKICAYFHSEQKYDLGDIYYFTYVFTQEIFDDGTYGPVTSTQSQEILQPKLTAGDGISISDDNTISVSYDNGDEVTY